MAGFVELGVAGPASLGFVAGMPRGLEAPIGEGPETGRRHLLLLGPEEGPSLV